MLIKGELYLTLNHVLQLSIRVIAFYPSFVIYALLNGRVKTFFFRCQYFFHGLFE